MALTVGLLVSDNPTKSITFEATEQTQRSEIRIRTTTHKKLTCPCIGVVRHVLSQRESRHSRTPSYGAYDDGELHM